MKVTVWASRFGKHRVLWKGELDHVPRVGDILTIDPDWYAFTADRIVWDLPSNTVDILVDEDPDNLTTEGWKWLEEG